MELYGRTHREFPSPEWNPVAAGETGLEDSMLRLGFGSGEGYPERWGVPDCVYYMRTGICGFGYRCRYNHPRDRAAVAAAVMATGDYPERPGEPPCQYYLRAGTCTFGATCKFNHPKYEGGSAVQVSLNIHGYPLRPGEKECSYYLLTGHCKFGVTCKFDHPQPDGVSLPVSAPPQFYQSAQSPSGPTPEQYGGESTSLGTRPPLPQNSFVPGTYGPVLYPPGAVNVPGWDPYSQFAKPLPSPTAQPAIRGTSVYAASPSSSGQREQVFPERPGEPECRYYMKTGNCKFGSACRYHHPREWVVPMTDCLLNALGLPLRQGVQACKFYMQNGYCKFGSTCKFDHPMDTVRYSPSESSFDMSGIPYPVGSLLATLPPELRPELVSGSTADFNSATLPSSGSNSSSSVDLLFSHTGGISTSGPLSSRGITRQEGEVHSSS